MKLHRKWDCHERALENRRVQSLQRERAFIHTSYPVREGKWGVRPPGRPPGSRGVGVSFMKRNVSHFEIFLKQLHLPTSIFLFLHVSSQRN